MSIKKTYTESYPTVYTSSYVQQIIKYLMMVYKTTQCYTNISFHLLLSYNLFATGFALNYMLSLNNELLIP